MKRSVLIVAAGSGSRMGGKVPKQFLELEGRPVLIHTLERFLSFDSAIHLVLVLAREHRIYWEQICSKYPDYAGIPVAEGGENRFGSVKNGLEKISDSGLIGIHDAVRPFVSQATLKRCFERAAQSGGAIPVIALEDSIRKTQDEKGSMPMDRSRLFRVQTPQVFHSSRIKRAYEQAFHPRYTDDASVYESIYKGLSLVEGNPENIKITTPLDLQLAPVLIRALS